MPTTLKILSRLKSPKYGAIYQVAVLGGPLYAGAVVSIPQLGGAPSRGYIDKIIVGKYEVSSTLEDTVCAVSITLRGRTWAGDRKPVLEVLEQTAPATKTTTIEGWAVICSSPSDGPWGTLFDTEEEALAFGKNPVKVTVTMTDTPDRLEAETIHGALAPNNLT